MGKFREMINWFSLFHESFRLSNALKALLKMIMLISVSIANITLLVLIAVNFWFIFQLKTDFENVQNIAKLLNEIDRIRLECAYKDSLIMDLRNQKQKKTTKIYENKD